MGGRLPPTPLLEGAILGEIEGMFEPVEGLIREERRERERVVQTQAATKDALRGAIGTLEQQLRHTSHVRQGSLQGLLHRCLGVVGEVREAMDRYRGSREASEEQQMQTLHSFLRGTARLMAAMRTTHQSSGPELHPHDSFRPLLVAGLLPPPPAPPLDGFRIMLDHAFPPHPGLGTATAAGIWPPPPPRVWESYLQ